MSRDQFEKDLSHLERIMPLLLRESSPGLPYWRRRVASLSPQQGLIPNGMARVTRLLRLFDEIERASTMRGLPGQAPVMRR